MICLSEKEKKQGFGCKPAEVCKGTAQTIISWKTLATFAEKCLGMSVKISVTWFDILSPNTVNLVDIKVRHKCPDTFWGHCRSTEETEDMLGSHIKACNDGIKVTFIYIMKPKMIFYVYTDKTLNSIYEMLFSMIS